MYVDMNLWGEYTVSIKIKCLAFLENKKRVRSFLLKPCHLKKYCDRKSASVNSLLSFKCDFFSYQVLLNIIFILKILTILNVGASYVANPVKTSSVPLNCFSTDPVTGHSIDSWHLVRWLRIVTLPN